MNRFFKKMYQKKFADFISLIEENIEKNKKMFIVTANPETFMIADENADFSQIILDNETTIVPDGVGIVKAANMLGYCVKERITGIDIAWELLRIGNEKKKSIYLFGATKEVIEKLEKKIKDEYPNINLLGSSDGYVDNKDNIMNEIVKKEPDIVMVALGIPNQEILIYKYLKQFKKGIFIGVGGSFDVMSGSKKRAPKIFQKMNIEWLYRIIREPKRMKRFYNSNIKFIFKVKKMIKGEIK